MRRKAAIVTALVMLVGATAAYAAHFNTYGGTNQKFTKGVGSKKKPVGVGYTQTLNAQNVDSTKAAAVLTRIVVKTYGLVSNAKKFPACNGGKNGTKFTTLKSDKFCPKLSKFATGHVQSKLGDPSLSLSNRVQCDPDLDVFNAGHNKLWFFFTTSRPLQCATLTTGDTAPYVGYVKQKGKYQIVNIPLPADISTRVANQPNFYGSLIHETLKWGKLKRKVHGKTYYNNVSVGCIKHKRPWTITYYSTTNGHNKDVATVKGKAKC